MCVCLCPCICAYMCEYVCGSQKSMSGIFVSYSSFFLFFSLSFGTRDGEVSLNESRGYQLDRLADQQGMTICLSLSPHSVLELLGLIPCIGFYVGVGNANLVLYTMSHLSFSSRHIFLI